MKRVYRLRLAALLVGSLFSGSAVILAHAAERNASGNDDRPQTPLAPFPYDVESVHFAGAAPQVELSGTLTLPFTSQQAPAVLLVHGSGPTDRDSSFLGHKPFLVLADALTRVGYAVLRYDKRGIAASSGDARAATTVDLAADAAAALTYLRSRLEVDASRIAVVGHSEGGTIAALLCGGPQSPSVCVSLAGMIAPFSEQLPVQEELTGKDLGADSSYPDAVRLAYASLTNALRLEDDEQRLQQMRVISADWQARFPRGHVNHEAASDSLLARPKLIASNWFRTLMQLDIDKAIRRGNRPILFVNGSTDRQVLAEPNLQAARLALGEETSLRRTHLLQGLNHMFQESESGSSTEYGDLNQTFSPTAVRTVVEFLGISMTARGEGET